MDLTSKFQQFFQSTCEKFSDFEALLTETAAQDAWMKAVELYRKGTDKLRNKDVTGSEEIAKANELLKSVIKAYNKDGTRVKLEQLAENAKNIKEETIEGFNKLVTETQAELEKAGMKVLLKEEAEPPVDSISGIPNQSKEDAPEKVTTNSNGQEVPVKSEPEEDGLVEKHPYREGFEEAMKRYTIGQNIKEVLDEIIKTHLYERTYNSVMQYQEGFKAGSKAAENLARAENPQLFDTKEDEPKQEAPKNNP